MQISLISCESVSPAEYNAGGPSKPVIEKEMAIQGCPQHEIDVWPDGACVVLDSNMRPLGFAAYVSDPALKSRANPQGECLKYTAHEQRGANVVGGKIAILGPSGRRTQLFDPFMLRSIAGFNGDVVSISVPKNFGALTGIKRGMMRKFAAGQKPIRVLSLPVAGSGKIRCSTSEANAVGLKITYRASTSPGSSGSPIYQGSFIVGTHVQSCMDKAKGIFRNEGALWFARPIGYVTTEKESYYDNGEGYSETDHIDGKPEGYFRDSWYDAEEQKIIQIEYAARQNQIMMNRHAEEMKRLDARIAAGTSWADWDDEEDESAEERRARRAREDDPDEQNRMQDEEESRNSKWRIKEAAEVDPEEDIEPPGEVKSCAAWCGPVPLDISSPNHQVANFQSALPKARGSATQGALEMKPIMNLRQGDSMNVVQAQTGEVVVTRRGPLELEKSGPLVITKEMTTAEKDSAKAETIRMMTEAMASLESKLEGKSEAQADKINRKIEQLIELVVSLKGEPEGPAVADPAKPELNLPASTSILKESQANLQTSLEQQPSTTKRKGSKKKKKPAAEGKPGAASSSETRPLEEQAESILSDQMGKIKLKQLLSLLNENGIKTLPNGDVLIDQQQLRNIQSGPKPSTL